MEQPDARPRGPTEPPEPPEVDLALARQLFEGDEATLRFVATVFLDEAAGQLDDLRNALAAGDARKVADAAHRLKGSVALFGARRATDLAERLQRAGAGDALADTAGLVGELERRVRGIVAELRALLGSEAPGAGAAVSAGVARGGRG